MANDAVNQYDSEAHNDFVQCPRCQAHNAPPDSDEFKPNCWDCGQHLNIQPVSIGDEVVVDVDDLHERGSGVGHTDDGFVVLVDGVLPEKRVRAKITKVRENYAEGELLETVADEIPDEPADETVEDDAENTDADNDDEETERLGARGDWWG